MLSGLSAGRILLRSRVNTPSVRVVVGVRKDLNAKIDAQGKDIRNLVLKAQIGGTAATVGILSLIKYFG